MLSIADFAKLRRLQFDEICDLALALVLIPLIAVSLRWKGLEHTHKSIARRDAPGPAPPSGAGIPAVAARISRMVSLAARRGPFPVPCLARSLTLQCLLRRHGLESELRIGVRKVDARLDAHAWVEHAGIALMEPGEVSETYSPFEPLSKP